MIRQFRFEDEIHRSLSCVPMAVRRKLDKAGVKISLEQWQTLGRGERLAICHLPVEAPEEIETVRQFIEEALANRGAGAPKDLPEEMRRGAEPPLEPPPSVVNRAEALGFTLNTSEWRKLDDDERYALIKLGAGNQPSHNFEAALRELLTR
jgi:hypothetical protein